MLYRRPFALCCIMFVLGTSLCTFEGEHQLLYLLFALLFFGLCLLLPKRFTVFAAAFACLGIGVVYYMCHTHIWHKDIPDGVLEYSGEVRNKNTSVLSRYIDIDTEKIGGVSYSVRLYVTDEDSFADVEINDILRVCCTESIWHKPSNSMRADGIDAYCIGRCEITKKDGARGFMPAVMRLRKFFSNKIKALYGSSPSSAALINAMALGDVSDVSAEHLTALRRTGTSHLICVSGLHFSILMGALTFALTKLRLQYKIRVFICIAFAAFYTLLIGLQMSAIRAALMCIITFVSRLSLRRKDSITSLTAALVIIVLSNPYAVYDIGVQFSFLSCAALIILNDATSDILLEISLKKNKIFNLLVNYIVIPVLFVLFATVFNIPIMLLNFDCFSVISPLSNLISALIVPFIMIFGTVSALAYTVFSPLGRLLSYFVSALIKLFESSVDHFSSLENACISTHIPGIKYIALITAVSVAFSLFIKKKQRGILYLACGLTFVVAVSSIAFLFDIRCNGKTTIYGSDGAERFVVICSDGDVLLLDSGENEEQADYVYRNGYSSVKYYIAFCDCEESYEKFKRLSSEIHIENAYFMRSDYIDLVFCDIKNECGVTPYIIDDVVEITFGGATVSVSADLKETAFNMLVKRKGEVFGYAESFSFNKLAEADKTTVMAVCNYNQDITPITFEFLRGDTVMIEKNKDTQDDYYKSETVFTVEIYDDGKIDIDKKYDKEE